MNESYISQKEKEEFFWSEVYVPLKKYDPLDRKNGYNDE